MTVGFSPKPAEGQGVTAFSVMAFNIALYHMTGVTAVTQSQGSNLPLLGAPGTQLELPLLLVILPLREEPITFVQLSNKS